MKKEIIFSSSVEEIRTEATEEELFNIFKERVVSTHTLEEFSFENLSGIFTARKTDNPKDSSIDLHQTLIDFLEKFYSKGNDRLGHGERSFNCIKDYLYRNNKKGITIAEFLREPGRKVIKTRNFGKKSFAYMKEEFERLCIPTDVPLFFQ